MPRQLVTEARDVLALPSFPITLQGRETEGLFWDTGKEQVVVEALHAITTPPRLTEVRLDAKALASAAGKISDDTKTVEASVIFGGYLLRHFGHFMHESLGRLWWLSKSKTMNALLDGTRRRLQAEHTDVVFFMPRWLDAGKDLPSYMAEVLTGLGLPTERIRIVVGPTWFRHLLIPGQCWGFDFDQTVWNKHLGWDCHSLMRELLGSYDPTPSPHDDERHTTEKLFITRTGLPLQLGRLVGDVLLDQILASAGFRIFHPERHPIAAQIRQYSQAKELVFMDGSALYLLWLCRLRPGVRIRVILRRRQGAWMCDQIRLLMPATAGLRWQIMNVLLAENLTSEKDWESHNLADLAALARRLAPHVVLSRQQIRDTLSVYGSELVANSSSKQLGRIVNALLCQSMPASDEPTSKAASLLRRLKQRWRRLMGKLAGQWMCRLTSP